MTIRCELGVINDKFSPMEEVNIMQYAQWCVFVIAIKVISTNHVCMTTNTKISAASKTNCRWKSTH